MRTHPQQQKMVATIKYRFTFVVVVVVVVIVDRLT